jgi:hypothetical protein
MTQPPPMGYQTPQNKSQGLSVASMVLGIVSVVLFCVWWLAIPCAIIAIVLGFVARAKVARGEAAGGGMATTGIALGIIALALAALLVVGVLSFLGFAGKTMQQQIQQQQQRQTTRTTTMMLHLHLESSLRAARHLLRM